MLHARSPAGMGQYVVSELLSVGRGDGGRAVSQNHDLVAFRLNVRIVDLKNRVAFDARIFLP